MTNEPTIINQVKLSQMTPSELAQYDHIHTPIGGCIKNRSGPPCTKPEPETKEITPTVGAVPSQRIEQLKRERDAAREEIRQLRLQLNNIKDKVEVVFSEILNITRY